MIYCCKIPVTILAEICIKMHYFYWVIAKNRPTLGALLSDLLVSDGWRFYIQHLAAESFAPTLPMASVSWGLWPQNHPLWIPGYASEGSNWKFWSLMGREWEKTLRSTGIDMYKKFCQCFELIFKELRNAKLYTFLSHILFFCFDAFYIINTCI